LSSRRPSQAARPAQGARKPRPLPPGRTLFTPEATPSRQALEHRSATSLLWLHQLPRWLPPVLAAALLIAGLALRGWPGAIALCGLAVVLAWLATISWPRLSSSGRLLRVIVVAGVLAVGLLRGILH
jgi:hypothetical protein